MKGIFFKSKKSVVLNICGIVAGIALIVMLPFFCVVDDNMTVDVFWGLAFFALYGLIITVICIVSLLFNKKAYLTVDENGVSSRFGLKRELKFQFSEIALSEYRSNSLTIILKNGKRYTIPNLYNADEICNEIRKNIIFEITTKENPQYEILNLKKQRTKLLILMVSFFVLMILLIFITVYLTDQKEMFEFTQSDWIIFFIFIALETINFIFIMFFANRCGKLNFAITQLKRAILETAPMSPGNLLSVYIDPDYNARVLIYGFPDVEDVYFIFQVMDKKFRPKTVYSSEVFSSIDQLKPMLDELIQTS